MYEGKMAADACSIVHKLDADAPLSRHEACFSERQVRVATRAPACSDAASACGFCACTFAVGRCPPVVLARRSD